jgi:hypothetical protein
MIMSILTLYRGQIMIKANGFPTRYSYACGNGKTFTCERNADNHISIFENDSHTCLDVKGYIDGHRIWEQFYHCDNAPNWNAIKAAEKAFNYYKRSM